MPCRFPQFCSAKLEFDPNGPYLPNSGQGFTPTISASLAATAAPASPTSTHNNTDKAYLTQITWNSTWTHLPLHIHPLHLPRLPTAGHRFNTTVHRLWMDYDRVTPFYDVTLVLGRRAHESRSWRSSEEPITVCERVYSRFTSNT